MATFATELLDKVCGDKELLLRSFMSEDMNLHHNEVTDSLCVFGLLDDIIQYRDKVSHFFDNIELGKTGSDSSLTVETAEKNLVDVGVTCDIWREVKQEYIITDATVEIGDDAENVIGTNAQDNCELEPHMEGSSNKCKRNEEAESSGTKGIVALSRRGRVIKRPIKLESNIDTSKLEEECQDAELAEPEIKHKRLIHPRKRQRVTKAAKSKSSRDKISVEEVRRLVQEEKAREAKEKGSLIEGEVGRSKVLLPLASTEDGGSRNLDLLSNTVLHSLILNGLSELHVQDAQKDTDKLLSEIKASEDTKTMKKYYEERMPYKFFCHKCSFKTKRESHYKAHMSLHEKDPYMMLFRCTHCDFTTIRQGTLQRHVLTHTENVLQCDLCLYKTNNKKQMDAHNKRHIKKATLEFMPKLKCNVCNFMTLSKMKLLSHMDQHKEGEGEQVYSCTQCKYKSKRKEHLVRHADNVHSDKRPFLCDLCGTAFKR